MSCGVRCSELQSSVSMNQDVVGENKETWKFHYERFLNEENACKQERVYLKYTQQRDQLLKLTVAC